MNTHLIIFILSLIGVAEALYLNYERKRKRPPVCIIGNDCAKVWASPYIKTFGVSNEILGIIFYAVMAVVEWTLFFGDTSFFMVTGEYIFLFSGTLMSFYFFYVQWRLIKAWCFWCTLSAVIVWTMTVVRFAL